MQDEAIEWNEYQHHATFLQPRDPLPRRDYTDCGDQPAVDWRITDRRHLSPATAENSPLKRRHETLHYRKPKNGRHSQNRKQIRERNPGKNRRRILSSEGPYATCHRGRVGDLACMALRGCEMRPADGDLRCTVPTQPWLPLKVKQRYCLCEYARNRARRIGMYEYLTGAFLTVAGGKAERLRCVSG
jgi:hypothetical protein